MMRPAANCKRALVLALSASTALAIVASGQGLDYVRTAYAKYEYRVPMRDGVKLFTSVYVPKAQNQSYPILMTRTPYSVAPYGEDAYRASLGPSELFAREGFIFVYQDVRGRMMSEGQFVDMRPHLDVKRGPSDVDESSDTYDTIEWLLKNIRNHNGRVGLYGISYPGFYTSAGMIDAHPALKAASPQAPISDWFIGDDFHHNGALYLPHAFNFFFGFGRPRPAPTTASGPRMDYGTSDGYAFYLKLGPLPNVDAQYFKGDVPFWTQMMEHETYDTFWQARNLRPHLRNIKPAVMTVGGWFDAEDLFGALETFKNVDRNTPASANLLVMGPWVHGGWSRSDGDRLGDVRFGSKTGSFYREQMELPFFLHHLKNRPDPKLPKAWVFETGRDRWARLDAWPPKSASLRSLYLRADRRLSFDPPAEEGQAFDEYVSDPSRPVPYTNAMAVTMTREHMIDDQRFASARPDVLTYMTGPLTQEITVAGPIRPALRVSTTGTDSDFVVKLIDVYPESADEPDLQANTAAAAAPFQGSRGYQQLVRGEAMRGKFRKSYENPEAFVPGAVTAVEYVMPDVFHTFRPGHRIAIQIQSSWFPLVNLNPQTFCNINSAEASAFQTATQRVYRSKESPSSIGLSVLTPK